MDGRDPGGTTSRRRLLGGAIAAGAAGWAAPAIFSSPAGAGPGTLVPPEPEAVNGANTGGSLGTSLGVTSWAVQPGMVIAALFMRNASATVTPPANPTPPPTSLWTQLATTTTTTGTLTVLYRTIASATTISPTFTFTSSRAALALANYGPTTASAPTAATATAQATSATVTGATVTAAASSRVVTVMGWQDGNNTLGAPVSPAGAAVDTFQVTTAGPNGGGVGFVSQIQAVAGTSTAMSATVSASVVHRTLTFTIPT